MIVPTGGPPLSGGDDRPIGAIEEVARYLEWLCKAGSTNAGVRSGAPISRAQENAADHFDVRYQCDEGKDRLWLVEECAEKNHQHPHVAAEPKYVAPRNLRAISPSYLSAV